MLKNAVQSAALIVCAVGVFAHTASAVVIADATGDEFSNNAHLDISRVEVTNDASNITFRIDLVGDPIATNWGKYMIGIDSVPGGDTAGNAWSRPISMSSGMDRFVGSWVDSAPGRRFTRTPDPPGTGWRPLPATPPRCRRWWSPQTP